MLSRLSSVNRLCVLRTSSQLTKAISPRIASVRHFDEGIHITVPDTVDKWGNEVKMNGLYIMPNGSWESANAVKQKRWNIYLALSFVGWCITLAYARTRGFTASGYFPLAICKDMDSYHDTFNYKGTDSTVYYQNFDEMLDDGEDEEDEDED